MRLCESRKLMRPLPSALSIPVLGIELWLTRWFYGLGKTLTGAINGFFRGRRASGCPRVVLWHREPGSSLLESPSVACCLLV